MPSKSTLTKLEQLVTDYENLAKQLSPLQEQQRLLREQIQSLCLKELDANNPKLMIDRTLLQFKRGYTTWIWNTDALNGYIAAGNPGLAEFRNRREVAATIAIILPKNN